MKIAPIHEVKDKLSHYVNKLQDGPILITKNGKPCAALVPVGEDDLEAFLLAHHPRFMRLIDRSYQQAQKQGAVPFHEVEARVKRRKK